MVSGPLPPGWFLVESRSQPGEFYYWDDNKGKSQWHHPDETAERPQPGPTAANTGTQRKRNNLPPKHDNPGRQTAANPNMHRSGQDAQTQPPRARPSQLSPDLRSTNLYRVLGLQQDATTDQIVKRFRELVRKYHPDKSRCNDGGLAFKAITEAHRVLTDTELRQLYDRTGFKSEADMIAGVGRDPSIPMMHNGFPAHGQPGAHMMNEGAHMMNPPWADMHFGMHASIEALVAGRLPARTWVWHARRTRVWHACWDALASCKHLSNK